MKPRDRKFKGTAICLVLSAVSALLFVVSPVATRAGLVSYKLSIPLIGLAMLMAMLILVTAVALVVIPGFKPYRRRVLATAGLALLPAAAGVWILNTAVGAPVIHDISSDTTDPPQFVEALAQRDQSANPLQRDAKVDEMQLAAFPDIRSLSTPLSTQGAFDRASAVADRLHWQVHARDARTGRIEATVTSFWFGFVDDIAIRIRADGNGSRIDVRSVSQVGHGDLGANAARIRKFFKAFAEGQ